MSKPSNIANNSDALKSPSKTVATGAIITNKEFNGYSWSPMARFEAFKTFNTIAIIMLEYFVIQPFVSCAEAEKVISGC
jgi:hypothetical protein